MKHLHGQDDPLIRIEGVVKLFPPNVVALDGVDLSVERGEIHSIIGENGAGKSTLMKVLYGIEHYERGSIHYEGRPVRFSRPREAVRAGIGMVHQEFMLVPSYSVLDNIILGIEPLTRMRRIDRQSARKRLDELIETYRLQVDSGTQVRQLSVSAQQKVEILKLLYRNVNTSDT